MAIFADIAGSGVPAELLELSEGQREGDPEVDALAALQGLREAGLIRGERRGVEMHNTSRCAEIDKRFPGLIAAIINAHKVQLEGKKETRGTSRPRRPKPKARPR